MLRKIEFADRELSKDDYSHLELAIQAKGAALRAGVEERATPNGPPRIHLLNPAAEFEDSADDVVAIEQVFSHYGFTRKADPG